MTLTTGVRYAQGQWSYITPPPANGFTYTRPHFGQFGRKRLCRSPIIIYVGWNSWPNAEIEAYLKATCGSASQSQWTLYGGVIESRIEMKVFSFVVASYEPDLKDFEWIIAPVSPAVMVAIPAAPSRWAAIRLTTRPFVLFR